MTAYAPSLPTPAETGSKLALVTLVVLAVHALLLLGLPHWARTVPVTGGPPVFQIRTIALGPPQPVAIAAPAEVAPAPPPRPKPRPKPAPKLAPPVDDRPAPAMPDSPPAVDAPLSDAVNPRDSRPPPGVVSDVRLPAAVPMEAAADARPVSLLQAPPLAVFGGTMPLPPIAPPLPPDQALAVMQQVARPRPASSAAPNARTPGTPDPVPSVQLPRPAEMTYQATVTQGSRMVALPSTINWRHDGQFYDLRWALYGPAIGDRSRFATGLVTARGLAPVTARSMETDAYNLTFDYAQSRLRNEPLPSASASADATPPAPAASAESADNPSGGDVLPPGAQDPLSVLIELGALIAGNPAQYPAGSRISLPVAGNGGLILPTVNFTVADDSDFAVGGQFTGQRLPTVHLVHEPVDEHDARIELWLGKRFDYLPLRLLFIQSGGDRLDMTLQSAYTQTVPPSSAALPASAPSGASDVTR